MKINLIVPFKRLSGGIRVAFLYANYLSLQGNDVVCYMPMISYKGRNQTNLFRIKASISNTFKPERWFDRKFNLKAVPAIKSLFIRDADVTIATSWQTAYDVDALTNDKGKKVYFVQDYEIFNGDEIEVDGSYQLGLHTITITKQLADFLDSRFHVKAKVIYNGIDNDEFITGDKTVNSSPVLMMMYHEAEHKGTKQGLEIVKQLKLQYPELQLNLFGRRKAEGIPSYANFIESPSRSKLIEMYRSSDIYLFTSKIEAWGLPVLEAMANKCAVIGFRVGALAEIANNDNCIVVEEFNFEALKVETEKLFKDNNRLRQIQNNGFSTASKFRWEESYVQFENILIALTSDTDMLN